MFNYFDKCKIGFVLLFSHNPRMLRFGYFLIGQNRLRGYLRKFFPLARTVRAFFVIVLTEDFFPTHLPKYALYIHHVFSISLLYKISPFYISGNTLEGHVSDVIALDQLTSPYSPRKATRMSPKIFRKIRCFNIHVYISIYTRVISWCLTSGEVQDAIRLVYIKNQYVVEDPSGKAADVFPRKIRGIR